MFRQCLANGVAAIHYEPVEDIDLSVFDEEKLPQEWNGLESGQSGSLRNVAGAYEVATSSMWPRHTRHASSGSVASKARKTLSHIAFLPKRQLWMMMAILGAT